MLEFKLTKKGTGLVYVADSRHLDYVLRDVAEELMNALDYFGVKADWYSNKDGRITVHGTSFYEVPLFTIRESHLKYRRVVATIIPLSERQRKNLRRIHAYYTDS